jgi:hypothetical protein
MNLLSRTAECNSRTQRPGHWDGRAGRRQRLGIKYHETYGYHNRDQRPNCEEDDRPLLDEMHALPTNGEVRSLWAATDKVADRVRIELNRFSNKVRLFSG